MPELASGERVWVLEVPYKAPTPGAKYAADLKAYVFVGAMLPPDLAGYRSKPYSYARWIEDELNAEASPGATAFPKQPRVEQLEAAEAIATAALSGRRGFWLADDPGCGKTGSAVLAAKAVLKQRGGQNVLITVDRPSSITIPAWRESIAAFGGDGGYRWLILPPDQLKKLLGPNGRPKYHFDVVINDEAQLFRHLSAQRTTYMRRVNKLTTVPAKAPFVITLTATPGHHPGEYTYLSSLLAQVFDEPPTEWADLGRKLVTLDFPLEPGWDKGTWTWTAEAKQSPRLQSASVTQVKDWLTECDPPVMLHRDAPWGPAPVEGLPVEFTLEQWAAYNKEWGDFQREMRLARTGDNKARGRAALLRFRQKASYLRAAQTAELVSATVERGYQVLVAVELVTTAADPVATLLEQQGIGVSRIFGTGDLERERLLFQRGENRVVVFNTASAINLQAGELMADGTRASTAKRIGYFHQPRYSGIHARQTIGRAHRDYQTCPWSLLYAVGTVEEAAAKTMVDRLLVTSASVAGDVTALRDIAALFNADWLPEDVFD
ncbi:DEAD/DEAH box helicase [Nocardiaceae bacterium YC2-7]|uniref:DEAD/DEAH box helicase n=2 Tax=Antrihabitans stalactiti TaxID=2584121 RepID=A0A848KR80_9NOCA|nr:DEAD/DEAH box helicase family protein [Antrihabitans stalactiti]NMN98790.1 DEAD/DEAH box helicase [Antrihabitans stalactiti]